MLGGDPLTNVIDYSGYRLGRLLPACIAGLYDDREKP